MGIAKYDARRNSVTNNNRTSYLEGVGTTYEGVDQTTLTVPAIMKIAGLDKVIEKVPSYHLTENGETIDIGSYHTLYRDDDGTPHFLGSGLKEQYTVLQNSEAFDFLQDMLGDVKIECAGDFNGGKNTFVCVSTEPIKIMDDNIAPYIVLQNSFDASSGVKVILTPIRTFCSNCMALAIRSATNRITVKHSRNVAQRLYIAKDILLNNTKYLEAIKDEMEQLALMRFTRKQFVDGLTVKILQYMGLYDADGKPVDKKRNSGLAESYRDAMLAAWSASDLNNYDNTAYKGLQAILDWESHRTFARNNENPETRFKFIIEHAKFVDDLDI